MLVWEVSSGYVAVRGWDGSSVAPFTNHDRRPTSKGARSPVQPVVPRRVGGADAEGSFEDGRYLGRVGSPTGWMNRRGEQSGPRELEDTLRSGPRAAEAVCFWSAHRVNGFFFQAEDGIRDLTVTGVQTCALPI